MTQHSRRMSVAVPVAVAILTIFAAYLARWWAEQGLDHGEPVSLAGDLFRLTLGENAGVAFGLLGGSPLVPWLSALALVAFALYLFPSLRYNRAGGISLGMVLGGGIANLTDRLDDGRVTDYLDTGLGAWRWPTFNLPDVVITVGFFLVVWVLARGGGARDSSPPGPITDRLMPRGLRSPTRRDEEDET